MSKNAINVIKPYKWNGMWVFDDQRVDLDKEPFVASADTMIDTAIEMKGIQNADHGFLRYGRRRILFHWDHRTWRA